MLSSPAASPAPTTAPGQSSPAVDLVEVLQRTHAIKQMPTQQFSLSRTLLNALQQWDNFHTGILRRGKKKSPTFFYITYAVGLKPRLKCDANEIRPFSVLHVKSV